MFLNPEQINSLGDAALNVEVPRVIIFRRGAEIVAPDGTLKAFSPDMALWRPL